MSTKKKSLAGRILASVGAAALGVGGVAGLATTAMADDAAWPKEGDTGTIQVHKKDMDEANLEGVGFEATLLGTPDGDDCVAFNLTTQEGWVVADTAIKAYNTAFNEWTATPGHPGGPTADEVLAAAGLCKVGDPTDPEKTATTDLGKTVATGLTPATTVPIGLYLIEETTVGANVITSKAAPFVVAVPYPTFGENGVVTWNYDVVANAKNVVTTPGAPTKVVDATNVDGEWKAGAFVQWTITATVPKSPAGYESIEIIDMPQTGLDFIEFVSVKNGNVDVGFTQSGTTATLDDTDTGLAAVNAAAKNGEVILTVVVKTQVPEGYAGGTLNNKARLDLNGKFGMPGGDDVTAWGAIEILKVDNSNQPLEGAEFAIYPATGTTCEAKAPSDAIKAEANTKYTVWIDNGASGDVAQDKNYCVLETKAPVGYVLDSTPKVVEVSATQEMPPYTFVNVPTQGPELPVTGANGTVLMTVGGIALVALAGGLYLATRRKATN